MENNSKPRCVSSANIIETKTLKCGIKVVMEPIDYVQSAAFGVWVKAGSVNENEENSGVSHYIEHMLFKGTKNRTARQIAQDIDRIGGQINAFTGKEATCFYTKTLGTSLETGADVVIDMLMDPLFDEIELDKERQVICEEIKMVEDQPDELAHDTILELIFKNDPLGSAIIGTPKSLAGIDRDRILDYKNRQYSRDSVVISVAGNFDRDSILNFLEDKFDRLSKSKEAAVFHKTPYTGSFKSIEKDILQSHLCIGTRGLSLNEQGRYSLAIINNVLGGSMSSRLFQNIREEKGLAYSVYSLQSNFSYDGYFSIYAGIAHDKIEKTVDAIKDELNLIGSDGITEEELEMSKEQIKSSFIFGQESVASRMFMNGKNMILLNRVYSPLEVINEYDKVTMDDIREVENLICDISKYSGVLVSDKEYDLENLLR